MFNHAAEDYICPICLAINGEENEDTWIVQDDIFYKDEHVVGFVSSKAIKGNEGHPLIVPVDHVENLYDLPEDMGHKIFDLAKRTAVASKEVRESDGVTLVQNNEPAGDQHAFHFHLHVVPRFDGDNFREEFLNAERSKPSERKQFAQDLKEYMNQNRVD